MSKECLASYNKHLSVIFLPCSTSDLDRHMLEFFPLRADHLDTIDVNRRKDHIEAESVPDF